MTPQVKDGHSEGDKRKAGNTPPQHRSKRNRYVSIACLECKRRKIRCSGQQPCERCGHLSLECLYVPNCCSSGFKDSEEFHHINQTIGSLQAQVNNLYAEIETLRGRQNSHAPTNGDNESFVGSMHRQQSSSNAVSYRTPRSPPSPKGSIAPFQGPTSNPFSFGVANTSLQMMGITAATAENNFNTSEAESPDTNPQTGPSPNQTSNSPGNCKPNQDPLWTLNRDEVLRLCRIYDEEINNMYPMLDVARTMTKAEAFFNFMDSASRTGLLDCGDEFQDDDSSILKLVLACASTVEGQGSSELGQKLFESVRGTCDALLWQPLRVKGLMLLVLAAQYHFHVDDVAQAYRITGLASRMCFEMGLHRSDSFGTAFKSQEATFWGVRLFWCVYVLDRRWSFGTGLPFAMQDSEIDPLLPEPDPAAGYLVAMVAYGRISSKAWRSISAFEIGKNNWKEDLNYLDYQIQQWQARFPEHLKLDPTRDPVCNDANSRSVHRLRILLYVRANLLRLLIYRPVLHSATSIMENRDISQTVVEVAKDTIRVLTNLNQKTDIYRRQEVCFNYFLTSALAVLFLAVSHAPVEFSGQVRDEFYMALDLVKGFSTRSYVSKRLWKTISGLKEIGPKLGVISQRPLDDPQASAAAAMAGLAGHPIATPKMGYSSGSTSHSSANTPVNGNQLSHELTNLFEAAGGFQNNPTSNGQGADGANAFVRVRGGPNPGIEGLSTYLGNEEEFSKILWDLF